MGPGRMQAGLLQFLPMLGVLFCATWTASVSAQESFPNELNSPVDEPQVIVREHSDKVPVRQASRGVQESQDPLVKLAWETREATRRRLLSTAQHTPWQMMHGLLGLRQDFLISHNGEAINGLEWMQTGPTYQNEPWFEKTQFGGRAHPYNKPYWFEGHINQSLAILAQCEVPLDTTFGTPKGPITMRDMLKNAQMTVNEKEEVTWTLWALCTYLPPDARWVSAKGEQWSIERLVQVEVGKPVGGPTSPCGGTHGLYALARARNIYMATGKPLRGVWLQADQKIKKYIQVARVNQNANGTLSSAFFKGKEFKQDFDKRMASTGHQLEFLMMALDDRQLKDPWVRRAVEATANDLMANRKEFVSCSPLYHATNALTLYLERIVPSERQQKVAQRPPARTISNSKDLTQSAPVLTGPGTVPPVPMKDVIGPATAKKVTPSTSSAAGSTAVAHMPTEVAKTPEIATALKQTPSAASAADGKDTPSTTTDSAKPNTGAAAAMPTDADSSDNPLHPVPLPDLTIPTPEAEKSVSTETPAASNMPSNTGSPGSTAPPVIPEPSAEATPAASAMPSSESPEVSKGSATTSESSAAAGVPVTAVPSAVDATLPTTEVAQKTSNVAPAPLIIPTTPLEGVTIPPSATPTEVPSVAVPSVAIPSVETSTTRPDAAASGFRASEPIVSAERPEHAGPSEAVAPIVAPVPLQKVLVPKVPYLSPDNKGQTESATNPSTPSSLTVPIKSVSRSRELPTASGGASSTQQPTMPSSGTTTSNPASRTSVSSSVTSLAKQPVSPQPVPAPASPPPVVPMSPPTQRTGEKPPALPAEKQQQPGQKPRWKATPVDRRKALSQNDKKRMQ